MSDLEADHHDLCPMSNLVSRWTDPLEPCEYCDLIARVREDEQMKEYNRPFDEVSLLWHKRGYAAALRDAVKAVYALPRIGWPRERVDGKPGDRYEEAVAVDAVVAEIEALGGEQ